jgi:hypothetical protein
MEMMMTKVIRLIEDGFVWELPAHIVADARAKYYEKTVPSTSYQEEYDFTMGNNYELTDWLHNNMNWEDVAEHARLVVTPTRNDGPMDFCNAEAEVVDKGEAQAA